MQTFKDRVEDKGIVRGSDQSTICGVLTGST